MYYIRARKQFSDGDIIDGKICMVMEDPAGIFDPRYGYHHRRIRWYWTTGNTYIKGSLKHMKHYLYLLNSMGAEDKYGADNWIFNIEKGSDCE